MKARRKKALARLQKNQPQELGTHGLVMKILTLSVQVNTKTNYCVMVRLSGHVDSLHVSVRESKEAFEREILEADYLYYMKDKDIDGRLKRVIHQLEHLLAKDTLDVSGLPEPYAGVGYVI